MASKAPRIILPKAEPGWASASSSPTLDSIPPGSDSPAKRRCISSACMPCRKRKSKCDGKQPTCNACKSVYSTECHYDLDADHRRKGALKRDIVRLKGEKSLLRSIIDSIKNGSEADVDDIVQIIRTSEPDASDEALAESVKIGLQKHLEPSLEALPSLEGELVSNFALRPSLDKTGESRHYGLTSNLSLQPVDEECSITMPADQSGAWTMVTSDRDLINHLLEVYFAWSHPWYLLFSEEIFFHGMRDRKAKYCTPLLMNAILAVGCHYSDRPEARADPNDPSTVGDHFFAEAQRLLMEDDNRSSLTIVQALGLMSLHQAKNNHDSSGRRYIAQMMSMAIELGLHISQGAQPSKITPSEIEARRLTFWGCFVLETAWSIAIGRISSLPRAAIRLEKPTLIAKLENTPWKPYGTPTYDGGSSELAQPSMKYSVLLHCSILSEIVDDIIHLFYAPRDRITSRKLQLYHEKLSQWYTDLPSNLLIRENGPTLPQIITLHCYYHNCIIHLFRPFLKVSFVQSSKPPRQICTEAANSISQLLGLHSRTYGLRRSFFINTHCLMTAAIIHLVNISSTHATPWRSIQTESYLAEAIRGLHDMKGSFICVGRYLHIIRNLVHKWCQDVPLRVREALDETYLGPPTSSTSISLPNPPNSSLTDRKLETATNGTKYDTHFSDRKHSAPEVLLMAPQTHLNLNSTKGTSTPQQQDLFWSPYDTFEGVPLAIPQENNHLNTHMDITSVLDSGINGDWPQWNRDGFMMGAAEDGPLWGINWDHSSSTDGVGK